MGKATHITPEANYRIYDRASRRLVGRYEYRATTPEQAIEMARAAGHLDRGAIAGDLLAVMVSPPSVGGTVAAVAEANAVLALTALIEAQHADYCDNG